MSAQQPSRIDEHNITEVAINTIIPNPRQPRKVFREDDPKLLELRDSIKEHGLLQPLIVTRLDSQGSGRDPLDHYAVDSWFAEEDEENATRHSPIPLRGEPSSSTSNAVQFQI